VRLGILWEAFETDENVFNFKYLEDVYKLVNQFGENGIMVILDAHQDLFSRLICGEGVPHFYAKKLSYDKDCSKSIIEKFLHHLDVCLPMQKYDLRLDNNSLPLIEDCKKNSFLLYHTSPELTSLYGRFYQNENGIIDKFIEFWSHFAKKFKNNPHIFGYDIWNEPFPGDMWSSIQNLIPGKADKDQILPFYKKVNEKLRLIDDNFVMVFQPSPFPDVLPFFGGIFAGRIEETPSGEEYFDKQVLNQHSYCCQAAEKMCITGEPQLKDADVCRSFHRRKLKEMSINSKNLKIPFIVTEFGACRNTESCFQEITSLADAADNFLGSWTYWQYKPFGDFTTSCDFEEGIFDVEGNYQEYKVKGLARTYIKSFQGTPISMKFNHITKIFRSKFYVNSNINAPTEIYHSKEIYYQNGINLKIKDFNILSKVYNITMNLTDDFYSTFKFEKLQKHFKDEKIVEVYLFPKSEYRIFDSNSKSNFIQIVNSTDVSNFQKESINLDIDDSSDIVDGNILLISGDTSKYKIDNIIIFKDDLEISYTCSINKECLIKHHLIYELEIRISNTYHNKVSIEIKYLMNNYIKLLLK
jgi:endoglycosylceramidase